MTDNKYPLSDLQDEIEEMNELQQSAPQRLRAYYFEEEEPPEDSSTFSKAPHQLMIESAAEWTLLTQNYFDDPEIFGRSPPIDEFEYLALGIATERLLNAIHLMKKPSQFIQHLEENNVETPDYDDSKQILISDLTTDLNDEQMRRICLIMDILRDHRNNIAHFGFHRFTFSKHLALIYQVLAFIFQRYSTEPLDAVKEMLEYYDQTTRVSEIYGHIDLPIDEDNA